MFLSSLKEKSMWSSPFQNGKADLDRNRGLWRSWQGWQVLGELSLCCLVCWRHTAYFPLCLRGNPPGCTQTNVHLVYSVSRLDVSGTVLGTAGVGHRWTDQLLHARGSQSSEDGCRRNQCGSVMEKMRWPRREGPESPAAEDAVCAYVCMCAGVYVHLCVRVHVRVCVHLHVCSFVLWRETESQGQTERERKGGTEEKETDRQERRRDGEEGRESGEEEKKREKAQGVGGRKRESQGIGAGGEPVLFFNWYI